MKERGREWREGGEEWERGIRGDRGVGVKKRRKIEKGDKERDRRRVKKKRERRRERIVWVKERRRERTSRNLSDI
jgi:hypothetical protein